ncbi:MAG: hypothetical protein IT450_03740 [Phycisphaerales bacterium]|nr:hypothetical protein [Phycisphaerales bacterium]
MAEAKSRRSYTRPIGMKPNAKGSSAPPRDASGVPPAWWGWLLLWIVTLSGVGWGLTRLDALAIRQAPERLRIEWVDLPDWLAAARKDDPGGHWASILTGLENATDLPNRKLYDTNLCEVVGQRIAQSAWVEQVSRITKTTDGLIRVHARFRKPFGLIEKGNIAYLIDESGTRLPDAFDLARAPIDRMNWYCLAGVSAPPPREGEPWPGEDVRAGLKLAQYLKRMMPSPAPPIRAMITAISVANWDGKRFSHAGKLRLATKIPGVSIHWGIPPGEEYSVEARAEQKLANMLHPQTLRWIEEGKSVDLRDERGATSVTGPDAPIP